MESMCFECLCLMVVVGLEMFFYGEFVGDGKMPVDEEVEQVICF